jgi:hypothetical protein
MKKFRGLGLQLDLDIDRDGDGDGDEDEDGGQAVAALPAVFHHQTSHLSRTGNASYGGTVNFRQGLTDAALQEYCHASQAWHLLAPAAAAPRTGKHARGMSQSAEMPLAKRLALGSTTLRRRLYGDTATFRSPDQEAAIASIIAGIGQIVVVMKTSGGKTL